MKKLISVILTAAALCVCCTPAVMAEDTVTAADIEAVLQESALINNEEDYAAFEEGTMTSSYRENFFEEFSPERAYPQYRFIDQGEIRYLNGIDPEKDKISDRLTYENYFGGHYRGGNTYIYADKTDPHMMGEVQLHGDDDAEMRFSKYAIPLDAVHLMFHPEELARIINEEQLGMPTSIKYIENYYYTPLHDTIASSDLVLLEIDDEEYIITEVRYMDDELSHYFVIPREEFIRYVQSEIKAVMERAYDNFELKEAPTFSDISGDAAVNLLARLGIIKGYSNGTFGADRNVTRAEAARIITLLAAPKDLSLDYYEYLDFNSIEAESNQTLVDVPDDHWAKKYIMYGAKEGYISGEKIGEEIRIANMYQGSDENGKSIYKEQEYVMSLYQFRPADTVSEQELVKMLVSAIDAHGDDMAQAEGGWPAGYVSVAKRLGICEDASDKPATRLTAAHMIKNALNANVTSVSSIVAWHDVKDKSDLNTEIVYNKGEYYDVDVSKQRVKLTGKITATSDTDNSLREKEIQFVITEPKSCELGYFNGELRLLIQYGDVKDYVGKDCVLYCERLNGNITVIMAE